MATGSVSVLGVDLGKNSCSVTGLHSAGHAAVWPDHHWPETPPLLQRPDRVKRRNLLALAQRREVDTVLVTELSRWGRSTTDLLMRAAPLIDPRAVADGFHPSYATHAVGWVQPIGG